MAIVGLGLDMAEMDRIEGVLQRRGNRFLRLVLTPAERADMPDGNARTAYVAGRFAAKEAAVKALGTGFGMGVTPQCLEVSKDAFGKPALRLSGAAAERGAALGVRAVHLTITHSRRDAAAVVILEN